MTPSALAARCNAAGKRISADTVRALIEAGKIAATRLEGSARYYWIDDSEAERFISEYEPRKWVTRQAKGEGR